MIYYTRPCIYNVSTCSIALILTMCAFAYALICNGQCHKRPLRTAPLLHYIPTYKLPVSAFEPLFNLFIYIFVFIALVYRCVSTLQHRSPSIHTLKLCWQIDITSYSHVIHIPNARVSVEGGGGGSRKLFETYSFMVGIKYNKITSRYGL